MKGKHESPTNINKFILNTLLVNEKTGEMLKLAQNGNRKNRSSQFTLHHTQSSL
jgi:hypothetical protein